MIESEKGKLEYFHDSLIDFNLLEEFNKKVEVPQNHEIFAIDLGGSSLKITTVRITYSGKKDSNPQFEAIDRMIFGYDSDPELKLSKEIKWYEWTVQKIIYYLNKTNRSNSLTKTHTAAFTFSYTLKQLTLDSALVIGCNKPFYFSK